MAIRAKIYPTGNHVTDTTVLLAEIAAASTGDVIQMAATTQAQPGTVVPWVIGDAGGPDLSVVPISVGRTPYPTIESQGGYGPAGFSSDWTGFKQVIIDKSITIKGDVDGGGLPKTVITDWLNGYATIGEYMVAIQKGFYGVDTMPAGTNWLTAGDCRPRFENLTFKDMALGIHMWTPFELVNCLCDGGYNMIDVHQDPSKVYPNWAAAMAKPDASYDNLPDSAFYNPIKSLVKDCTFKNYMSIGLALLGTNELEVVGCTFKPGTSIDQPTSDFLCEYGADGTVCIYQTAGYGSLDDMYFVIPYPARNVEVHDCTVDLTSLGAFTAYMPLGAIAFSGSNDSTNNGGGGHKRGIAIHNNMFVNMNMNPASVQAPWGYWSAIDISGARDRPVVDVRIYNNSISGLTAMEYAGYALPAISIYKVDQCVIADNICLSFNPAIASGVEVSYDYGITNDVLVNKNQFDGSALQNIDGPRGVEGLPVTIYGGSNIVVHETGCFAPGKGNVKKNVFVSADDTWNVRVIGEQANGQVKPVGVVASHKVSSASKRVQIEAKKLGRQA